MVFVDREVDQAVQGVTQAQAKIAEQLSKLAIFMLERMNEAKEKGEALEPEQQEIVDELIARHCMDSLEQHGTPGRYGSEVTYECERYILSYDPDDATGMPMYRVHDRDTDSDAFMFQRHPRTNEFVFFDVENPLTDDQKKDFVNALAQRPTVEKTRDASPIEQVKAQLENFGDLAPRGSKAAVIADVMLSDRDRLGGNTYSLQREADGGLSIFRTSSNELILNVSGDGSIKERMTTADTIQFDKMYSSFKEMQSQQSFASVGKTTPDRTTKGKSGVDMER